MVATTGGEELMKTLVYFILFVMVHVTLAVTTSMFFMTWGAKRNTLEKIYVFFIGSPFNWGNSLWFLPLNGIIWAAFFYILVVGVRKLLYKRAI